MSRSSRRSRRPSSTPPTTRPASGAGTTDAAGTTPDAAGTSPGAAGTTDTSGMTGGAGTTGAAGTTAGAAGATGLTGTTPGAAGTTGAAGSTPGATGSTPGATGSTPGATGSTPRSPSASARAGRRERQRAVERPTFMARHRTIIVVIAAFAGVALLSAFVFLSASSASYACSTEWTPAPTSAPAAGATPALGYVQPNMGADHKAIGEKVTYTYCAPATGNHFNKPGVAGPITPRVYGPGDAVLPQGWLHNLEHGGLVVLYTGSSAGATPDGQAQLRAFYDTFPVGPVCGTTKGINGPVIARFDQMTSPFQAIVWGRVLFLDTFDQAKILAFWDQWGERTNPEQQCPVPSAQPSATPAAPSPS